jgi:DNA-binding MarR family transcriptional regulator
VAATASSSSSELEAFSAALVDFLRATRRVRGRLGDEGELSLSQFHLLEPLLDCSRLGVCELADAAGVSAPTATRMLAGLERDGLVSRSPCLDDRRVVRVVLTDEGRARTLAKRLRGEARRAEIFESLSEGERREAARLLERLTAAMDALR